MEVAVKESIELGGRQWRALQTRTLQLVDELEMLLTDCKVDRFAVQLGESTEDAARRLLRELRETRQLYLIIGHLIVPGELADVDWTPEAAKQTAAFVGKLTDESDHAVIRVIVLNLLIAFFASGLRFTAPSVTASAEAPPQPAN